MNFYREDYSLALFAEILPLLALHHEEVKDKFYGPLNPDLTIYETLEKLGMLRIFTVRQWSGSQMALMGYQVFFINNHHHSKDVIAATQDILFMHKDVRKGLSGYKFIQWCAEKLKMEGIHIVHQRISARHSFGRLLERAGYELEDLTYSKKLQEAN